MREMPELGTEVDPRDPDMLAERVRRLEELMKRVHDVTPAAGIPRDETRDEEEESSA